MGSLGCTMDETAKATLTAATFGQRGTPSVEQAIQRHQLPVLC